MIRLLWVVAVLLVELIAPTFVSVLVVIANMFLPDMVPFVDEILGVAVVLKKMSGFHPPRLRQS